MAKQCWCKTERVTACAECNSTMFTVPVGQELEDIMSALDFFIAEYPNKGSAKTKAAMKKILKKMWGAVGK